MASSWLGYGSHVQISRLGATWWQLPGGQRLPGNCRQDCCTTCVDVVVLSRQAPEPTFNVHNRWHNAIPLDSLSCFPSWCFGRIVIFCDKMDKDQRERERETPSKGCQMVPKHCQFTIHTFWLTPLRRCWYIFSTLYIWRSPSWFLGNFHSVPPSPIFSNKSSLEKIPEAQTLQLWVLEFPGPGNSKKYGCKYLYLGGIPGPLTVEFVKVYRGPFIKMNWLLIIISLLVGGGYPQIISHESHETFV